jgi:hypothetical protein
VCQVMLVLLIFVGPLFSLFGPLSHLHWRGTFEYGRLASRLGHEFEARWTRSARPVDAQTLAAPDFSATTDLFSISANIREMNLFVLDSRAIIALTVATLLPFALHPGPSCDHAPGRRGPSGAQECHVNRFFAAWDATTRRRRCETLVSCMADSAPKPATAGAAGLTPSQRADSGRAGCRGGARCVPR